MRIEKTKKVNFKNLKVGDCYLGNDGVLCMKTDSFF